MLVASRNGKGKRSKISDYSIINRGGQGVIGMKLTAQHGELVGAVQVFQGDEVILISDQGTLVRIRTDQVSSQGRNTQGVRLINLTNNEHLVGLESVEEPEGNDALMPDDVSAAAPESALEEQAPPDPPPAEQPPAEQDKPPQETDL